MTGRDNFAATNYQQPSTRSLTWAKPQLNKESPSFLRQLARKYARPSLKKRTCCSRLETCFFLKFNSIPIEFNWKAFNDPLECFVTYRLIGLRKNVKLVPISATKCKWNLLFVFVFLCVLKKNWEAPTRGKSLKRAPGRLWCWNRPLGSPFKATTGLTDG